MKRLQEFTDDELRAELVRRERTQEAAKPKQIEEPNWGPVIRLCQVYIDDLAEGNRIDSDIDIYISEATLTAVFGDGVWPYIRSVS